MMNSSMGVSLFGHTPSGKRSAPPARVESDHFKQKMARQTDHRCRDDSNRRIPLTYRPPCPILNETVHFNAPDAPGFVFRHDHVQEIEVPSDSIPQIHLVVGSPKTLPIILLRPDAALQHSPSG
jgi:hypothetical protein